MIVVDMEATGLNKTKHALCALGAVSLDDPNLQYYAEPRVWDDTEFSDDALEVNGMTIEQCTDKAKPDIPTVMNDFLDWMKPIENKTLAAQNPSNDRDFINEALSRSSISWRFSYRTVDLHTIAYMHFILNGRHIPIENDRTDLSLDDILEFVGLPPEPKPHNALNGAKRHAEAIQRLWYKKVLLPEFEEHPIPEYLLKAH